jgi:hypothetical protein
VAATLSATLNTFLVGTRLAGQNIVLVDGVYPPGFTPSITGGVVAGDGHVVLGSPGVQFGTPNVFRGTPAGGVPSAQQFGTPTIRSLFTVAVGSVGSAQSFGTIRANVRLVSGGVTTAQAFGVPQANYRFTPAGVASAQQFGAIAARLVTRISIGGVSTAQQFGAVKTRYTIQVAGVASAQLFGGERFAQRFFVPGVPSAQAFGTTDLQVYIVYLHDSVCQDEDLDQLFCLDTYDAPICGEHITGEVVAGQIIVVGGYIRFLDDFACLTSPSLAVLNEFLVGDGTLVGGAPWIETLPPAVEITLTPAPVIDLTLTES